MILVNFAGLKDHEVLQILDLFVNANQLQQILKPKITST